MIKIAIVSPCYNEESIILKSAQILSSTIEDLVKKGKISCDSLILYVNDGSEDKTWDVISSESEKNKYVCAINLRNNVGHQNAILAGMMEIYNDVDAVVTIDADIQDDVLAIENMIDEYSKGADIVYGIKTQRKADPIFKKISAKAFYRLQKMCGISIVDDHADFRLMSRNAIVELARYTERNIYLRGIIPAMGLSSSTVKDIIKPRIGGNTKYTISKMFRLACDGITSFSNTPINFILYIGLFMMLMALGMFAYVIGSLLFNYTTPGWASILMSLWFIGSVITLSIGIIGIYIGKIYIEVKNRPLYSIRNKIGL